MITPDIVLAEIGRKYAREGARENVIHSRLRTMAESSQVSQIDEECAVMASSAYIEMDERAKKLKLNKPSLFDAMILGMARMTGSKVLTCDPHFRGLPETLWLS